MSTRRNRHGHTEPAKKVLAWALRHSEMVTKVYAGEIIGLATGSGRKRLEMLLQKGKVIMWVWGCGRRQQLAMMTSNPQQLVERLEQEFGQRQHWEITIQRSG